MANLRIRYISLDQNIRLISRVMHAPPLPKSMIPEEIIIRVSYPICKNKLCEPRAIYSCPVNLPFQSNSLKSISWQVFLQNHHKIVRVEINRHFFCNLIIPDCHNIWKLEIAREISTFNPEAYPFQAIICYCLSELGHFVILHASALTYQNTGLLFTARSGAGKSTLARIYESAGAKILDDDKILLCPGEKTLFAFNTGELFAPINSSCTIDYIFEIAHAKRNQLSSIPSSQKTASLLRHIQTHPYHQKEIKKQMETIQKISHLTAIYHLGFLPDLSVIQFIKNATS